MQIMGYLGAYTPGGPSLSTDIGNVTDSTPTVRADIAARADFKALSAADQALVGRLWSLPFHELVAARLASIKREAWGGLTAEQVQARIPAFYYAFIRRVNDRTDFIKMGNRNKALALWLLTAYEPNVRDAYFAVKNKTKFTVPDAARPEKQKTDKEYNDADDTWKNLYYAVDLAVKGRFPNGVPASAATAVNNANQAKQTAAAATNTAQNVAADSGNAAAKKAADEAAAEKKRADAAAKKAEEQAALAKAANDKAAAEAEKAAAADKRAKQAQADLNTAKAANERAKKKAAEEAQVELQRVKDEADRKAADAAAVALQAAAAAEAKAAEAIAVSQSREADLLAQQAEAEEKKKKNRNIAMAVGGVAVVGALVWFARRNK